MRAPFLPPSRRVAAPPADWAATRRLPPARPSPLLCAGMVCGLVGQAVANTAMLTRRALRAPDPDDDIVISVPPLLKTALVWGLFMGVSANTRYQLVVGLERCAPGRAWPPALRRRGAFSPDRRRCPPRCPHQGRGVASAHEEGPRRRQHRHRRRPLRQQHLRRGELRGPCPLGRGAGRPRGRVLGEAAGPLLLLVGCLISTRRTLNSALLVEGDVTRFLIRSSTAASLVADRPTERRRSLSPARPHTPTKPRPPLPATNNMNALLSLL